MSSAYVSGTVRSAHCEVGCKWPHDRKYGVCRVILVRLMTRLATAEKSRWHSSRPVSTGGRIGFKKGGFSIKTKKVKPGSDQEFTLQKGVSAAPIKQSKVKGKGLGSGIKPSEAKDILKSDKITRSEYLKQWSPHFGGRNLKKEMKARPDNFTHDLHLYLDKFGKDIDKFIKPLRSSK